MKSYKKILLTAAASLIIGTQAFAAEKLRIGTEGAYPPFNLIDASGQVGGFDLDISHALCAKTEERKNAVDFTDHYYTNKLQFVAPKSVDFKADKGYLKGKVIGAQRATIAGTWLEDNMDGVVTINLYDTQENAYLDLATGRVDGILADTFVQWEWLKSDAGKDFEFKGEPVFDDDKIAIAVRKGNDQLRERLNKALADIIADGTYKQINEKYFPFSIY